MKALKLIIAREFFSRAKTKAFLLTTLITPFLMILVMVLPTLLMMRSGNDIDKVFVRDKTGLYAELFKNQKDFEFEILPNDQTGYQKGEAFALLEISADLSKMPNSATFFSEKQKAPDEITSYVNRVLSEAVKDKKMKEYAASKELTPEITAKIQEIAKASDDITINTLRLDEESGEAKDTVGTVASLVGVLFTFIMFFFIMMYGSLVMQSVVEEKSNRIVEVIISSVKPFHLMMGKIVGVALTGLLQVAVWAIIIGFGIFAITAIGGVTLDPTALQSQMQEMSAMGGQPTKIMKMLSSTEIQAIFNINWFQVIACFVLYFVGGYLLFASLFAMFGSAANDSQEAQQFMTPVMLILMVAFYTGFAASQNPEGNIAFWFSLIPFTSPVVMMVRTPFEIPIWELVLSIFILYLTVFFMIKIAAKIYRIGILMTGKKVGFKDLAKWINYK